MKNGSAYNGERFPFSAIFERLTDYMQGRSISPLDAYLLYQAECRKARLTPCPDYASTSITSGGHARRATSVRKIVSLVDPHVSLGGQTERYFARNLGLPVYLPRAVKPADGLEQVISARRLSRDVDMIISYGGTVCEVADHSALVCLRDDIKRTVDTANLGGGLHRAKR